MEQESSMQVHVRGRAGEKAGGRVYASRSGGAASRRAANIEKDSRAAHRQWVAKQGGGSRMLFFAQSEIQAQSETSLIPV